MLDGGEVVMLAEPEWSVCTVVFRCRLSCTGFWSSSFVLDRKSILKFNRQYASCGCEVKIFRSHPAQRLATYIHNVLRSLRFVSKISSFS